MTGIGRQPVGGVVALVALAASALAIALGATAAEAADPRLDLADESLVNAAALLAAANTGGVVPPKAQREFDRAVARAIADIASAREEIVKAQNAVDNP